jgi:hypothetical protein
MKMKKDEQMNIQEDLKCCGNCENIFYYGNSLFCDNDDSPQYEKDIKFSNYCDCWSWDNLKQEDRK